MGRAAMNHLSAVTIVIDLPTGYTVAGAMLADFGPFDTATVLIDTVRNALGERWVQASPEEIRAHYEARYRVLPGEPTAWWEQLSLF